MRGGVCFFYSFMQAFSKRNMWHMLLPRNDEFFDYAKRNVTLQRLEFELTEFMKVCMGTQPLC